MEPGSHGIYLGVGSDERYALPMAVTIHSALSNLSPVHSLNLLILDAGLTDESRNRLERIVRTTRPSTALEWHSPDLERFEGVKMRGNSKANYLRLLVPELIGERAPLVLYLDSDLVIKRDLGELWEAAQRLEEVPVAAVGDYLHPTAGLAFGEKATTELGLDPSTPYFNSGVLAINAPVWRAERVSERAVEASIQHSGSMTYSDQDALNIAVAGRWGALDARWNVMLSFLQRRPSDTENTLNGLDGETRSLLDTARILHYSGRRKPWLPGYIGLEGGTFRSQLHRSGWFSTHGEALAWRRHYWLNRDWVNPAKKVLARSFRRGYRFLRPSDR